jgi:glutaredoxin-related protein
MKKIILCLICITLSAFSQNQEVKPEIIMSKTSSPVQKKYTNYNLVLYMNPRCGYCQKVLDYLNNNNISIPMKNTQDPGVRGELVRIGGKGQIPCLVINGEALYESDAIIEWFKNHK